MEAWSSEIYNYSLKKKQKLIGDLSVWPDEEPFPGPWTGTSAEEADTSLPSPATDRQRLSGDES